MPGADFLNRRDNPSETITPGQALDTVLNDKETHALTRLVVGFLSWATLAVAWVLNPLADLAVVVAASGIAAAISPPEWRLESAVAAGAATFAASLFIAHRRRRRATG